MLHSLAWEEGPTDILIYRSRAGSPHELFAKKAEWILFSRPIFSGCIHFLEALSTALLGFTSMPQQAGNKGKEGILSQAAPMHRQRGPAP